MQRITHAQNLVQNREGGDWSNGRFPVRGSTPEINPERKSNKEDF